MNFLSWRFSVSARSRLDIPRRHPGDLCLAPQTVFLDQRRDAGGTLRQINLDLRLLKS